MKGAQYALPFIVGNARILYFNMDILNEAGVTELPTTWQDLVDVVHSGEGSQSGGRYPLCTGMGRSGYRCPE
ncbi:extracellular solute-binding protein [Allofournierella massiliensis]|uniref:extracellular solute-binding protein n=1 Tax=Allofournierella massiliensis TaxID=1650663 RepID=UPI00399FD2B6